MNTTRTAVRPIYDTIGQTYTRFRRADPRIVEALVELLALPAGSRLADVGAGTGNYTNALAERGFRMVAVEPSPVMRSQAPPHERVRWVAGAAEALPLADAAVDGVVCTLAVHHFRDRDTAFREMVRAAGTGPLVLFTFDVDAAARSPLWLWEYFPTLHADSKRVFPPLRLVARELGIAADRPVRMVPFPLPPDLEDLFMAAGWRRPELYLDPEVRAGISWFALAEPAAVAEGLARLEADLRNGDWDRKHGAIRHQPEFDAGYRFLKVPGLASLSSATAGWSEPRP
jgi:SAM-dependent methyltransferase